MDQTLHHAFFSGYIEAPTLVGCTGRREAGPPCAGVWARCVSQPNTTDAYAQAVKRELVTGKLFLRFPSDWSARLAQEARYDRQDAHLRLTGKRSPEDCGYRG